MYRKGKKKKKSKMLIVRAGTGFNNKETEKEYTQKYIETHKIQKQIEWTEGYIIQLYS